MQNYVVELIDNDNCMNTVVIISADGYCAEIEARTKYPNYKIGNVIALDDYLISNENVNIV